MESTNQKVDFLVGGFPLMKFTKFCINRKFISFYTLKLPLCFYISFVKWVLFSTLHWPPSLDILSLQTGKEDIPPLRHQFSISHCLLSLLKTTELYHVKWEMFDLSWVEDQIRGWGPVSTSISGKGRVVYTKVRNSEGWMEKRICRKDKKVRLLRIWIGKQFQVFFAI